MQYNFALFDEATQSAGSAAVDAPEWIVPVGWPLDALAEEFDLHLVKRQNFHEAVREALVDPIKMRR